MREDEREKVKPEVEEQSRGCAPTSCAPERDACCRTGGNSVSLWSFYPTYFLKSRRSYIYTTNRVAVVMMIHTSKISVLVVVSLLLP